MYRSDNGGNGCGGLGTRVRDGFGFGGCALDDGTLATLLVDFDAGLPFAADDGGGTGTSERAMDDKGPCEGFICSGSGVWEGSNCCMAIARASSNCFSAQNTHSSSMYGMWLREDYALVVISRFR